MAKSETRSELTTKRLIEICRKAYESADAQKRRERYDRYLKEFTGEWWDSFNLDAADSKAFVNFIFSTIQTTAPLLTDNRPIWRIIARTPYTQRIATMYRRALEYLWDTLEMERKSYFWVLDMLLYGNGILKVYFDPETDEIRADVVDPRTFLMPAGYDDIWEAPWCGQRRRMPLSWIRMHYPKQAAKVKPDGDHSEDTTHLLTQSDLELEEAKVTVYELWIRDYSTERYFLEEESGSEYKEPTAGTVEKYRRKYPHGRIITFTECGVRLEDRPSPFAHGRPPYVHLYDYPVPHHFWAMGEADQIEAMNQEFNLRFQQLVEHARKHTKTNYVTTDDTGITQAQFKKALREGNHLLTAKSEMGSSAKDAIAAIDTPSPNRSIFDILALIPDLMEEVSGNTDMSKGMASKKERQSAREISVLIESSYTRTRQRVRNYEHAIKRAATLCVELMQQFYTEPRSFSYREDNEVVFGTITNSAATLLDILKPELPEGIELEDLSPEQQQELSDYHKLVGIFGGEHTVYVDFAMQVDTNSTLPLDKQTLYNLALRLVELGIIDPEAVLDVVHWPNKDEVVRRMKEKEAAANQAAAAQAGPTGPPRPGGGQGPQGGDIADQAGLEQAGG